MYPFIIISRNRKSCVEKIVNFASKQKVVSKIIIMDMGSEYPLMKEYLENISNPKVQVFKLNNIGPRNLWTSEVFRSYVEGDGFFLTDGDIDFSNTNPHVLQELISVSARYKYFKKVGCALSLKNLPKDLAKSKLIWESECDNWSNYRKIDRNIYLAPIDTTIAFYPKYSNEFFHWPAIRLAGEFSVIHWPWYVDYNNLSEEDQFYINNAKGWGGFGTSSERGSRPEDINFKETKLYKFRILIKLILQINPGIGSMIISKVVNLNNSNSKIEL
jgi:hypothetical protein